MKRHEVRDLLAKMGPPNSGPHPQDLLPADTSEHEANMFRLVVDAQDRAKAHLESAETASLNATRLEQQAREQRQRAHHEQQQANAEKAAAEHLLTLWEE